MMYTEWIIVFTIGLVWLVIMRYSVRSLARTRPGASLVRKRLWCPTMEQEAEVEFLVEGGVPSTILSCSLVGSFDVIECRKTCIKQIVPQALEPMIVFGSIQQGVQNLKEPDAAPVCDTQECAPIRGKGNGVTPEVKI